jgi:polysaccharide pyruvyl transferase WcaK-like protein
VKKTSSPQKIALMGPFGYGNLGDAAIQQAMIENVYRYFPNAAIIGVSMNPQDTQKRHGISSFPIGRVAFGWGLNKPPEKSAFYRWVYNLRTQTTPVIRKLAWLLLWLPTEFVGYLEACLFLKDVDLLIVSGGGQLDDYWGGPWHHPFTLMMWGIIAYLRNVPYQFISIGAGPLDTSLGRLFDRVALSLATYRSYRDEKSKKYMAAVTGFRRDDPVYPDLAFSLQIENTVETSHSHKQGIRPIVGIGPMAYFDPRVWPQKDQNVYTTYLNKLADFILWVMPRGYDILLFPGEAVHDLDVIHDLKTILSARGLTYQAEQILHPHIETVNELMVQLATADMMIASRFHGVLLSKLLSKPLIALSYHSKIDELMTDTGQGHYCLQIHDFELEKLKLLFTELETNLEIASQQIAHRVEQYRAALDEQYAHIFGKS